MGNRGFRIGINSSGTYNGEVTQLDLFREYGLQWRGFNQTYPPYSFNLNGSSITSVWDVNNNDLGSIPAGSVGSTRFQTSWNSFRNCGSNSLYDITVYNATNSSGSWRNAYTLDATSCKLFQAGGGIASSESGSFPEWQAGDTVYGYNQFGFDSTFLQWSMMGVRRATASGQLDGTDGQTRYNNGNGNIFNFRSFLLNSTRNQFALRMTKNSPTTAVGQQDGPFSIFMYNNANNYNTSGMDNSNGYNKLISAIFYNNAVSNGNGAFFASQVFGGTDHTGLWWGPIDSTEMATMIAGNYGTNTLGQGFRIGFN